MKEKQSITEQRYDELLQDSLMLLWGFMSTKDIRKQLHISSKEWKAIGSLQEYQQKTA